MVVGIPAVALPSPTTITSPSTSSTSSSLTSPSRVGDIVGAVIAAIVAAGCIAGVTWWVWRRKARMASRSSVIVEEVLPEPSAPTPPPPTYPPPSFPLSSRTPSLPFRSLLAAYLSRRPPASAAATSVTAADGRAEPPRYKEDWDEEEKVEGLKKLDAREGSVDMPRVAV
ncbi:hypothetical protein NBRC10512_006773 [Rhodotorula toruloides]|uniref:RHTO0S12e00782g1_1 n=2 Tax=Rhodotorula toruloides TaxID=5286 RepID=A0A061B9W6_RHOTO|nr:uncharacterized protein RHTO_07647 [Rhodotorula toruloides NP11]EMS23305.1 hypothetical protein RHTO_07647 [Rhodotorula toruloides NP11]KAJ8291825.1 hypothetical protein OF846_005066 [Rhodotorula toruloides]CDR46131.1 RHTO0S12e00782g1_1 [Rhodotorula toruloides]